MNIHRPTTPSQRSIVKVDNKDLTKGIKPVKSLLEVQKQHGGRDNKGKVSVRHQGGGNKIKYRIIDFNQGGIGASAEVLAIEYDPNRTTRIARIQYENKKLAYILAVDGLKVGDKIECNEKAEIITGNRMYLKNIPVGTPISNVELVPGNGGKMARSAGVSIQLSSVDNGFAQIILKSGEVRMVKDTCLATIGAMSNKDLHNVSWGKAGIMRHLGIRPTVRGSAMNACDHPHGGGKARSPIGNRRGPRTPWGKSAMGPKTRKKKKYSNKFIIRRRK